MSYTRTTPPIYYPWGGAPMILTHPFDCHPFDCHRQASRQHFFRAWMIAFVLLFIVCVVFYRISRSRSRARRHVVVFPVSEVV